MGNAGGSDADSSIWALPWREKAEERKGKEGRGKMCVRISTGTWCASCRVCFKPSGFCSRNTECKEGGEGSKAGKVGAGRVAPWYCEKLELHSVDNKEHGGGRGGAGAVVAKVALDLAMVMYSVPLGPRPQSEWSWMDRTTGNIKSYAILSGPGGSSQ